ncbi:iron-containing alcohol dehydrogenase [Eubacteriales bacterium OttesenSCG-928-N14]|nr:iron-containing alcohol dehydrogenase [Eubacteriales bacterium OttesenSCG-928-N14]
MKDFVFEYPIKVVFGHDAEVQAGPEAARLGGKKALIHHDSGAYLEESGLLPRVRKSLEDAGLTVVELGGVRPNPRLSLMREGIKLAKEEGIDVVVGIGGGSVLDSSKTIAVGAKYDGDVWDFATFKAQIKDRLPIIAINTMSGTGSETSICAMVVNDEGEKEDKRGLFGMEVLPNVALINPALQFSLPPKQVASGAMDIISHTLTTWFTETEGVYLTDRLAEGLIETVLKYGPLALRDPEDYNARAQIAASAALAVVLMVGYDREGRDICHGLENPVTTMHLLAHGTGLAIMYPAWMKMTYKRDLPRFVQFANRLMGVPVDPYDPEGVAWQGILRFESFIKDQLGLPTRMKDIGIHDKTDIEMLADRATQNGTQTMGAGKYALTRDEVLELYKMTLE